MLTADLTHRMPRFIWADDGGVSFIFDGHRIKYERFRTMIQASLIRAVEALRKLWFELGLGEEDFLPIDMPIADSLSERAINYSYLRHPANQALRDHMGRLQDKVLNNLRFCHTVDGQLYFKCVPVRDILRLSEWTGVLLLCSTHLCCGQVARSTELTALTRCNADLQARCQYMVDRCLVFVAQYNKTTLGQGQHKLIPRATPPLLGEALIHWDLLQPIFQFFQTQHPAYSPAVAAQSHALIFHANGKHLDGGNLTASLEKLSEEFLGIPLGTAAMRQLTIFIGVKYVRPLLRADDDRALLDLQAGHSTETAELHYGRDAERLPNKIDSHFLNKYRAVSHACHVAFGLLFPATLAGFVVGVLPLSEGIAC